jgi:hypothetical protein
MQEDMQVNILLLRSFNNNMKKITVNNKKYLVIFQDI